MKALSPEELGAFLNRMAADYDVRVPIRLLDGTRSLGRRGEGELALEGGSLPAKPTCVFFPQTDTVFVADDNTRIHPAAPREPPLFVVGWTVEDLACLAFIDRFFSTPFRDALYCARRDAAIVVGLSGFCGPDGGYMTVAGGQCDLELIVVDGHYLVAAYTDRGRELEGSLSCAREAQLPRQATDRGADDWDVIERAAELIGEDKVPEAFWEVVGRRCIACGSCNFVCPTCTCFEMYDRRCDDGIERRRMWDSCQFEGFMREAGGHNPMALEWCRTRRRIHHKLIADVVRWGQMTCFKCGRCDTACPSEIGIKAVCESIVERYG